ncbi:MAG TPA: VRR-NUC domain-containing protein [Ktedonobacterales bacterium]|nr:VRR-NUC domain-containing protein [Ktedonobacterales bacterium]
MPRAKKAPTLGAITAGRLSRPLSASDAAVWDAFEHDGGALPAQFMQRLYAPDTPPKRPETEASFMAAIIELATLLNWRCYHTHDSRRSEAGYPDLTCVKGQRIIFAELKTDVGRVRPAQREWLAALAGVPGVLACVWRPRDWPAIQAALMGETAGVMALASIPERPAKRRQAS